MGMTVDSSTASSLSAMYADLQTQNAEQMKTQSTELMSAMQGTQSELQVAAKLLTSAKELQQKAGTSGTSVMPNDMVQFFRDHNLNYVTLDGSNACGDKEWATNIQTLNQYLDSRSADAQSKMVYLQDYISQYNSYLQGTLQQVSNK